VSSRGLFRILQDKWMGSKGEFLEAR